MPLIPIGNTDDLPVTCWGDEAIHLAGNALVVGHDVSQNYGYYQKQNPYNDGDSAGWDIILSAGTYTFRALVVKGPINGLVDWYLDTTKIVSQNDHYSASNVYNVVFETTGIVLASSKKYRLKYVVNGKNAASTDYRILLTKAWFGKTV